MRKPIVVLAVLAVAAGLFWWTRSTQGPVIALDDDVRQCKENLRSIYAGLIALDAELGHPPEARGVAFFAALVASGTWAADAEHLERLSCPGPGAHPVLPGTDFADTASLTGASSAYAGRDAVECPLDKFPAGGPDNQALIACDNAIGMNHDGVMNVLYTDGTIKTLELARLIESGIVPVGSTSIPIGPDSPIEDLRHLSAD